VVFVRSSSKTMNILSLLQWATSIGFMAFIILQAYADPSMEILGALYLTTKSTSEILIYVNILTTIMVIMTAFSDWRITIMNRRIQELRSVEEFFENFS